MKNEKILGYHVSYESAPEDVLGEMRWVTTFIEDIDQAKRIAEEAVEHATEETKLYIYAVHEVKHGEREYYNIWLAATVTRTKFIRHNEGLIKEEDDD